MDVKLGDGVALVVLGDTMVVMWQAPASLARWQWQMERQDALMATQPSGIIFFYLILSASDSPDAKLRWTMKTDFERIGDRLRGQIVVPLGDSVRMVVVRAIVRAILLMSGHSKRQVVVSTIKEGLLRVQDVASRVTPSHSQLLTAVRALAAALKVTLPVELGLPIATDH